MGETIVTLSFVAPLPPPPVGSSQAGEGFFPRIPHSPSFVSCLPSMSTFDPTSSKLHMPLS
ncbi:hypothetical protein LX36DRAFT_284170 [Colletotrichum falcatum]|nr:hypothetical protein LX36DRAFT_284170 [Colletotrichum falcatum]